MPYAGLESRQAAFAKCRQFRNGVRSSRARNRESPHSAAADMPNGRRAAIEEQLNFAANERCKSRRCSTIRNVSERDTRHALQQFSCEVDGSARAAGTKVNRAGVCFCILDQL